MSNKSNGSQDKSIFTLSSIKNKEKMRDSIPCRINFIKDLMKGQKFDPLINFDNAETEQFTGGVRNDDNASGESYDTRILLKKRVLNFTNVIERLGSGGKLEYIKSGTTGHAFRGEAHDENGKFEYGVKVVAYPKKERYGNIYDSRRPENAELMMIKLLSYFIVKKHTPHIVLPIGTFNTSIETFIGLIDGEFVERDNQKYIAFEKAYKKGAYFDQVSILISEWANKGDLLDFIKTNYRVFTPMHWKVIFFQLISTLAVIQSKFPAFRHNDLKANNILVHKINKQNESFIYTVVRCQYKVPNIGYQIKLWDFDFACIPGIVDNIKVASTWTESINVTPTQNRYYDLHYFFNTLIKRGFFSRFMTKDCIPKEAKDFVNRIVPPKYQEPKKGIIHERGRILINTEYILPDDVLKYDPYFEEFRMSTNKTQSKTITNKKHNITPPTKQLMPDLTRFLKDEPDKPKKVVKQTTRKNKKSRTISEEVRRLDPDLILNGSS